MHHKSEIMKKIYTLIFILIVHFVNAQSTDSIKRQLKNSAQTLIDSKDGNLLMAAYG